MANNTEFICEVVRVTGTRPHPNADRLEFVEIEGPSGGMAYQIISQKGNLKVGNYAVYIGEGSMVPRGTPGCDFLFEREDGKTKQVFRVRAARLRGQYSEGFLLPYNGVEELGTDMSKKLGIYKWDPPVKGPAFPAGAPSVAKDQTLGGKFPIYGVDSLKKLPNMFSPGTMVVLEEKLHGTNMRCGWVGGRFIVGSHRVIKTDIRPWYRKLWDKVRGRAPKPGYYGTDIWSRAAEKHKLAERLAKFENYVFYFELYGKGIQDLTYGDVELGIRLLDVFDSELRTWCSWRTKSGFAKLLGLETPPVLYSGLWFDLEHNRRHAEGESVLAPGQVREGFVAHAYDDDRRGKLVGQGYLLRTAA